MFYSYDYGVVMLGNAYVSVLDEGDLDVRAVAQKSAVISLRHSLETLGKWKISYAVSTYYFIVASHGVIYPKHCSHMY